MIFFFTRFHEFLLSQYHSYLYRLSPTTHPSPPYYEQSKLEFFFIQDNLLSCQISVFHPPRIAQKKNLKFKPYRNDSSYQIRIGSFSKGQCHDMFLQIYAYKLWRTNSLAQKFMDRTGAVVSAPLQTYVQRWIPPGLYYVVLKFMLGLVRTILPSRFQFKFN